MKPQVLAVALLTAVLMTPAAQARTFEMTGIGQDVHFEKNLLTTCTIGDPRSCKTQLVAASDVVPLDDNWYLVVVDPHNYYSCTLNFCEPHPTSDADRGWRVKGAFVLNAGCFYDVSAGLNCTQAEPFRRASQLVFADIFRTGKAQVLSLSKGLLCDADGGPCRTTSGLGLLARATRIAALVTTFVPRTGLLAIDPDWQTACRYATSTATTIGFACSQASATDAPGLFEPWIAGPSVFYVPLPTTTPMAHPDANGDPLLTDNVAQANRLNTSFGTLNATYLGPLYVPEEEPMQMFTIDVPAMTAAGPDWKGRLCKGCIVPVLPFPPPQTPPPPPSPLGATALVRDAQTEGVTADQSAPPPAGTAYTMHFFSDQTATTWPVFKNYDECFSAPNGPECGHGDSRKAAGDDIINRYNFPGILCPWIGTWQKVDETTGLFSIASGPGCNPAPPLTYPTYSIVTPKPMTRDQCIAQCGKIATIQGNYCTITTAQIAGVSAGLTVVAGVASGIAFTAAAGPQAGVAAGVGVGRIFGTAVGGVTVGYGVLCSTMNSYRQNQCIQKTCGG